LLDTKKRADEEDPLFRRGGNLNWRMDKAYMAVVGMFIS
jgi:hypothetical protein